MESLGGRKFVLACVGMAMLFAALMLTKMSGTEFVGGVSGILVVYGGGNLITQKLSNGGKKK